MPKIKVGFYMAGNNVELNAITEELNLQPTKTRKKNEWPQASISAGLARDIWELETEKEECKAVSIQMNRLQGVLFSKLDTIKKLKEKYSLETSVTIVIEMEKGNGPEIVLLKENTEFLSLIGAEVGFDLYID